MSALWWLLIGGAALAAGSTLLKRRKLKDLPDVSNEEFLSMYRFRSDRSDSKVIEERKAIAESLGVPYQKLSPSQTFKSFSRYTGFIGEYEIGMSDLGDELAHVCKQAGLRAPDPFPETVEEFINEMMKAKNESKE